MKRGDKIRASMGEAKALLGNPRRGEWKLLFLVEKSDSACI
jgi:hypothetical protein